MPESFDSSTPAAGPVVHDPFLIARKMHNAFIFRFFLTIGAVAILWTGMTKFVLPPVPDLFIETVVVAHDVECPDLKDDVQASRTEVMYLLMENLMMLGELRRHNIEYPKLFPEPMQYRVLVVE